MTALLHYLLGALTGGRPMFHLGYLFTDRISGEPVGLYRDTYGREWMATSIWGWDRVPNSGIARRRAKDGIL